MIATMISTKIMLIICDDGDSNANDGDDGDDGVVFTLCTSTVLIVASMMT
jgi:hypothetical protein